MMNRTGRLDNRNWAELVQRGLGDEWNRQVWDRVDHCDKEFHIVQVLELRCNAKVGDIVHHDMQPWVICKIWNARDVADGKSILLYAHPTEVEVQSMTEEEWQEIYGPESTS